MDNSVQAELRQYVEDGNADAIKSLLDKEVDEGMLFEYEGIKLPLAAYVVEKFSGFDTREQADDVKRMFQTSSKALEAHYAASSEEMEKAIEELVQLIGEDAASDYSSAMTMVVKPALLAQQTQQLTPTGEEMLRAVIDHAGPRAFKAKLTFDPDSNHNVINHISNQRKVFEFALDAMQASWQVLRYENMFKFDNQASNLQVALKQVNRNIVRLESYLSAFEEDDCNVLPEEVQSAKASFELNNLSKENLEHSIGLLDEIGFTYRVNLSDEDIQSFSETARSQLKQEGGVSSPSSDLKN